MARLEPKQSSVVPRASAGGRVPLLLALAGLGVLAGVGGWYVLRERPAPAPPLASAPPPAPAGPREPQGRAAPGARPEPAGRPPQGGPEPAVLRSESSRPEGGGAAAGGAGARAATGSAAGREGAGALREPPGLPPSVRASAAPPPVDADDSDGGAGDGGAGAPYATDAEGIRSAVRDALPALRECFEAWQRLDRALRGRLSVKFSIEAAEGTRGRVTGAALVDSELAQPFMEGCVLNVMQGLRFEAPADGRVEVRYPLQFEPRAPRSGGPP